MIHVQFRDFEDMMCFARQLTGLQTGNAAAAAAETTPAPALLNQSAPVQAAPVAAIPQQAPVQAVPVAAIPQQALVQAAPAAAPPQPQVQAPAQQPVPTTAVTYTLDDLARAATTLMDSGKQPDLLQLIASFGVEALPALPPTQYGAFATALRGMGAQI